MTNIETVKRILPRINSRFTTAIVVQALHANGDMLTRDQVGKALRSISYVNHLGNGKFQVKGRKVK